ncbi:MULTISPECIES: hypothetical protein [unclassified Bradyrhizobium]|uniref:hypothetical protein n=1 Tax=unclassified Bradyrhizobium TaxID=2631580 RepID=UPI0028E59F28|nr:MULTISPECIES: hypothetical protein [unclassified Bradyrhizobium]
MRDQRRQHEAEQNGQRHGNEDVATEIQQRDDDDRKNGDGQSADQAENFLGGTNLERLPADHHPITDE